MMIESTAVDEDSFRLDVVAGLARPAHERRIPSRYLYDQQGCELFEAICETPEYYLTRTELSIMHRDAQSMADVVGPHSRLIELGSGASLKTQLLLDRLPELDSYVPVDIAPEYLRPSCDRLRLRYPALRIEPVCANFAEPFSLPATQPGVRNVVYFPGSTIGNFTRPEAARLIHQIRDLVGPEGGILIGMDLKKDPEVLNAAYNDSQGVTAAFTSNLLTRIQRELDCELQDDQFQHFARYNEALGRIEIYLQSLVAQTIRVGGHVFTFEAGELINTEYSYKYSLADVQQLALHADVALTHAWLDERNWFGVFFLTVPQ